MRSSHTAQDWRHFDLTGIAIGWAQAQYPMDPMFGGAK
jgi:hypothetical protein